MATNEQPTFHAIDSRGRSRVLKAEAIEVRWPDGRTLTLGLPFADEGDIELQAEAGAGVPVITLKPAACNLVMLDVAVLEEGVDLDDEPEPTLTLTVQNAVPEAEERKRLRPKKKLLRQWANAALMRDANVTLRWVGEAEGRKLNADFRDKDYATNVLTFVYDETDGALTGDVVICLPVVVREAEAQGKSLTAHLANLVVHGMLHLQGMDHEDPVEAEAMEAMEREILASLGYPDPYAE